MTDFSKFLEPGAQLALAAGKRAMELLQHPLTTQRKADKSIVTNADHAANDLLRHGLGRLFPAHAILSEETGLEGAVRSELTWVIDPLDGTKAFARKEAGFSVMLGLMESERPVLGIVYDPWEDRLYEAAAGAGAFLTYQGRRERVTVSERRDWREMPMITSSGFPEGLKKTLESTLGIGFLPPINSVGIKVGYLARREADLYLNHHAVHYWDTAAPLVILEQAGGRMTQWDGSPLTYTMDGRYRHAQATVATNGTRHQDLVGELVTVGKR